MIGKSFQDIYRKAKKYHEMRWWNRIWKRGLCINDAQDRNKWRRCYRWVVDHG